MSQACSAYYSYHKAEANATLNDLKTVACLSLADSLPCSWNFVRDYKTTPHFLDDESGKNVRLIFK
jgi:hypothetical protein